MHRVSQQLLQLKYTIHGRANQQAHKVSQADPIDCLLTVEAIAGMRTMIHNPCIRTAVVFLAFSAFQQLSARFGSQAGEA